MSSQSLAPGHPAVFIAPCLSGFFTSSTKKRTGKNFRTSFNFKSQKLIQPLDSQQEKYDSTIKITLGARVWINRDPITEQGGLNLYSLINNNPTNYIDKNGLFVIVLAPAAPVILDCVMMAVAAIGIGLTCKLPPPPEPPKPPEKKCGECPPCGPPPPSTIRLDLVPPSAPHYPCKGSHMHITTFTMLQAPNCKCFPKKFDFIICL